MKRSRGDNSTTSISTSSAGLAAVAAAATTATGGANTNNVTGGAPGTNISSGSSGGNVVGGGGVVGIGAANYAGGGGKDISSGGGNAENLPPLGGNLNYAPANSAFYLQHHSATAAAVQLQQRRQASPAPPPPSTVVNAGGHISYLPPQQQHQRGGGTATLYGVQSGSKVVLDAVALAGGGSVSSGSTSSLSSSVSVTGAIMQSSLYTPAAPVSYSTLPPQATAASALSGAAVQPQGGSAAAHVVMASPAALGKQQQQMQALGGLPGHVQVRTKGQSPPPSRGVVPQTPPSQQQSPGGSSLSTIATTTSSGGTTSSTNSNNFQRLKVEDALTYLDMVKFKFGDKPQVYNDFLDIMKEFKTQSIDTPGVIARVSSLFNGYPELIVGFNTFLPPGYKIEVQNVDKGLYTYQVQVSMPSPSGGTTSGTTGVGCLLSEHTMSNQKASTILCGSGTIISGGISMSGSVPQQQQSPQQPITLTSTSNTSLSGLPVNASSGTNSSVLHNAPSAASAAYHHGGNNGAVVGGHHGPPPVLSSQQPPQQQQQPSSGGPAQSAHHLATHHHHHNNSGAAGGLPHNALALSAAALQSHAETPQNQPVEFNHAINYVNKIKNRFQGQPEKYKKFLEILHAYQKEQRTLKEASTGLGPNKHLTEHEVYSQVAKLFENQDDLLDEFGQFLPDATSHMNAAQVGPLSTAAAANSCSDSQSHPLQSSMVSKHLKKQMTSKSYHAHHHQRSGSISSSNSVSSGGGGGGGTGSASGNLGASAALSGNSSSVSVLSGNISAGDHHGSHHSMPHHAHHGAAPGGLGLHSAGSQNSYSNSHHQSQQQQSHHAQQPQQLQQQPLSQQQQHHITERHMTHKSGHISSQVKRSPPYPSLMHHRDVPPPKKHKLSSSGSNSTLPQSERNVSSTHLMTAAGDATSGGGGSTRSCRDATLADATKYGRLEDYGFFDKLRKALKSIEVYNNFLRCLSLFNQEIISKSELIQLVTPFLGKFPELLRWFRDFLGQNDNDSSATAAATATTVPPYNVRTDRPQVGGDHALDIDYSAAKRLGASYGGIPPAQEHLRFSGRTQLCHEVLNNKYVSFPTWSEDSSFVGSRKNQYEEYMYRCEDERFELDVVIETNASTIRILEGAAKKLNRMGPDELNRYQLEDCIGGPMNVLHHKALRRIYGDKAGDIIEGLNRNPAVAVPVVLRRLKTKEEEWREAQKGFNKIWREQNEKYYLKSLDYQGINFKQNDVKALRSKSLINDIETALEERNEQNEDGAQREQIQGPHLTFTYSDRTILDDAANLLIHHMKRQTGIQKVEKRRIKHVLRQFVPDLFFHPRQQHSDDDQEEEEEDKEDGHDSPHSNSSKDSKKGSSTKNPARANNDPSSDRGESGVVVKEEDDNKVPLHAQCDDIDESYTLFMANNNWYLFLRLHATLCNRLAKIYERAVVLAKEESILRKSRKESTAMALRLKPKPTIEVEEYYPAFLDLVKNLLDGNMDANAYEDTLREMFGIHAYTAFTLDKVVSYAVRQLQHCVTERSATLCSTTFLKEQKRGGTGGFCATAHRRLHAEYQYQRSVERGLTDDNCFKIFIYKCQGRMTIEMIDTDSPDEQQQHQQQHNNQPSNKKVEDVKKWSQYKEQYASVPRTNSVTVNNSSTSSVGGCRNGDTGGAPQGNNNNIISGNNGGTASGGGVIAGGASSSVGSGSDSVLGATSAAVAPTTNNAVAPPGATGGGGRNAAANSSDGGGSDSESKPLLPLYLNRNLRKVPTTGGGSTSSGGSKKRHSSGGSSNKDATDKIKSDPDRCTEKNRVVGAVDDAKKTTSIAAGTTDMDTTPAGGSTRTTTIRMGTASSATGGVVGGATATTTAKTTTGNVAITGAGLEAMSEMERKLNERGIPERHVTNHPGYEVHDDTHCSFNSADAKITFTVNKESYLFKRSAFRRAKKLHPAITRRLSNRFHTWLGSWHSQHVTDHQKRACVEWLMGRSADTKPNRTWLVTDNDLKRTPYAAYNRYRVRLLNSSNNSSTSSSNTSSSGISSASAQSATATPTSSVTPISSTAASSTSSSPSSAPTSLSSSSTSIVLAPAAAVATTTTTAAATSSSSTPTTASSSPSSVSVFGNDHKDAT